jgi:hypothetical protein
MRRRNRCVLAMVLVAAAGCGMKPAPLFTTREIVVDEGLPLVGREDLLNELSIYHGVPYARGGESFDGVDCSGLARIVFEPLGVRLPRTAAEQSAAGIPVTSGDIRTGDLVFFGSGAEPDHVGIAVSSEEMVHASSSRGVVLERIDVFAETEELRAVRRIVNLK